MKVNFRLPSIIAISLNIMIMHLNHLDMLKEWLPRVEQDLKVNQEETAAPRKIFITYAHQDTESQQKLKTHLAVMESGIGKDQGLGR